MLRDPLKNLKKKSSPLSSVPLYSKDVQMWSHSEERPHQVSRAMVLTFLHSFSLLSIKKKEWWEVKYWEEKLTPGSSCQRLAVPENPHIGSLILFRAPLEPWYVSAPGEKGMLWLTEKHVSENCLSSSKLMRQKEIECHPVDASPLNAARERRKRAKKQSKLLWLPNHSSFRI